MTTESLTSLSLRDLLEAGLHFGHQTKRWNPKMKRYIFDKRNGIHIIDLTQTLPMLETAARFLQSVVQAGKPVLFVGTKKQAQEIIQPSAEACGQFYVTQRWLGGTLTNSDTIRRSIRRMRQIETMARNNNGVLSVHKKEASNLRRELDKLQRNLSGIADMQETPGAMFVVDICRESIAVAEARRMGVPVVAITDTNADPDLVDYIIPGNDDAIRSIKLVVETLSRVLTEAVDAFRRQEAERVRQKEAERVAAEAASAARRRVAADTVPAAAATAPSKTIDAEKRKLAARAARKAVEARFAAAAKSRSATTPAARPSTEPVAAEPQTPAQPAPAAESNSAAPPDAAVESAPPPEHPAPEPQPAPKLELPPDTPSAPATEPSPDPDDASESADDAAPIPSDEKQA